MLVEMCEKPQYGWTTKSAVDASGYPILRITDIQDGQVDWSVVPRCVEDPPEPDKYLLKRGDLLVARSGATVGKSYMFLEDREAVFASYLIRLRPGDHLLNRFLAWYFQSPEYWRQLSSSKTGMAQPNVNGRRLGQITIPVPELRVQAEIADQLDSSASLIRTVASTAHVAVRRQLSLRSSILARAFSGEL
jgi:type I restriction enzyme S subunit